MTILTDLQQRLLRRIAAGHVPPTDSEVLATLMCAGFISMGRFGFDLSPLGWHWLKSNTVAEDAR